MPALFLGLSLLFVLSQNSSPPQVTFADVTWESDAAAVKQRMAAVGLSFVRQDGDGDLEFKGAVMDFPSVVFAYMAAGRVVKVQVILLTPNQKAREQYSELKQMLTDKYGEPRFTIEHFKEPYYAGDGFEEQAIRLGKATFASLWQPSGDGKGGVVLEITEELNLRLAYESPAWPSEAKKRKAKKATIL